MNHVIFNWRFPETIILVWVHVVLSCKADRDQSDKRLSPIKAATAALNFLKRKALKLVKLGLGLGVGAVLG